ncbi:hypothetical protein [Micromonospora sp. NBC_00858]|uniref:hypothetical protein n=1 Tax=Micromonospora sp. NBC_00858 TaxID=2975979 RepID=UPI00386ED320|nr:hypothetical protein OG990_10440 [Micromonospora sp. NBC_00858]
MSDDDADRTDAERGEAVRQLVAQVGEVGRVSGREPWRELVSWLTRGRWGRRAGWPAVPVLITPWQDTLSAERHGWRTRAANLAGDFAFAVDYRICRRCRIGWVEQPHTHTRYRRQGLASAGLAALRAEYPGLSWHTLGGHFRSSQAFWAAVGLHVPGGYHQRRLCPHLEPRR